MLATGNGTVQHLMTDEALSVRVDAWMAINNVVRVVKGAVPAGYAPGFILDEYGELDNSKPQVGALALRLAAIACMQ